MVHLSPPFLCHVELIADCMPLVEITLDSQSYGCNEGRNCGARYHPLSDNLKSKLLLEALWDGPIRCRTRLSLS